jgi:hypothetical protein
MLKSKINPAEVKDMVWNDYVKKLRVDMKKAESTGISKTSVVMISDFTFACGEVHTLMLLGKKSVLNKFFKSLKMDSERKKLKDFSFGFCHFEKEEDGSTAIKIAIKGFGKPSKMKKNGKKLFKKLGVTVKDIIKGEFLDEVIEDITNGETDNSPKQIVENEELQNQAEDMKADDDTNNDVKLLGKVAKEFTKSNRLMNKEVLTLLKLAKEQPVIYIDKHVKIAEDAFRTAASLLDKYEEIAAQRKNLDKTASKITQLKEEIEKKDLVKKYEMIWKKVKQEYGKQLDKLSEPLKVKFDELNSLLAEIKNEIA